MDANSSILSMLAEARMNDLRREAAEYAMSQAARRHRPSRWARFRTHLARRVRREAGAPSPVSRPAPLPAPDVRPSA